MEWLWSENLILSYNEKSSGFEVRGLGGTVFLWHLIFLILGKCPGFSFLLFYYFLLLEIIISIILLLIYINSLILRDCNEAIFKRHWEKKSFNKWNEIMIYTMYPHAFLFKKLECRDKRWEDKNYLFPVEARPKCEKKNDTKKGTSRPLFLVQKHIFCGCQIYFELAVR